MDVSDEDLPDWLQEVQEEDRDSRPVVAIQDNGLPDILEIDENDEELPDWLQEVQAGSADHPLFDDDTLSIDNVVADEDLPDWLSDMQADNEPFEPSEPSPVEPEIEVGAEDLPDWLQEVQEEGDEELVEEVTSTPERIEMVTAQAKDTVDDKELPAWLQDLEDEVEPLPQLKETLPIPEPIEAQRTPASFETAKPPAPPVAEPVAQAAPIPEPAPVSSDMPDWLKKLREGDEAEQQVAPPAPIPTTPQPVVQVTPAPQPPAPTPAPLAVADNVPADAAERLQLAQAARDKGDIEEAVRIYDSLIISGVYLDKIIEDMQQSVKSYPSNYLLYQVMGDAMMRDGRLQSALEAYRQAMTKLSG
jgi:tetratricopeptide (TPR) repeat protein